MANPPRLSVQTQPGPSTPAPSRRPQGARRRNVVPGLYIANPDKSDEESGSPSSLTNYPASSSSHTLSTNAQRSPVRGSPVTTSSGGSVRPGSAGSVAIPPLPSQSGSPRSNPLPPIPSIPAPQPSPIPHSGSSVSSPQVVPPTIGHSAPPRPPPQPERHVKRAQTTPVLPDSQHRPHHESRPSLGSSPFHQGPHSPTRALPPLPSPPIHGPLHHSPPAPTSAPISNAQYPPPTPSSSHSNEAPSFHHVRMASPENALSPANTIDSGKSFGSHEYADRTRSGSTQSSRVRVQVTTDNESFTTVDITGMTTAAGIKDRVFSKLRFRDDEHANLSLYRTDVDEQPDSVAVTPEALLHLCQIIGDAKATLKFFVMHTTPSSAGANIVPPTSGGPRIDTDNLSLHAPVRTPSRHSKDGSLSSASDVYDRGTGTSASDWSEIGTEEAEGYGSSSLVRKATTRSARFSSRPMGGSNGKSPLSEHAPGPNSPAPSPTRYAPQATYPSSRNGSMTPTPGHQGFPASQPQAGSSSSSSYTGGSGASSHNGAGSSRASGLGLNFVQDMDEGTRALIASIQAQEEAESAERRRQLAADEELARREQQSERDVWERMQEIELRNSRTRRDQIEQDERRAREMEAELRRQSDEEAAQAAARTAWDEEQREAEQSHQPQQTPSRSAAFAEDRRQRAQHWQNASRLGSNSIRESAFESHTLPSLGSESSYSGRRPSDSHYEVSRQHQYPQQNPLFEQQSYTSPNSVYEGTYDPHSATPHRPTGFATNAYDEQAHSTDRLNDPRLRQALSHPGQRLMGTMPRRTDGRQSASPDLQSATLQNARSMDNLRPYTAQLPVSRSPYQGVPTRSAHTPGPQSGSSNHLYRTSSNDYPQDGRYPGPPHHAQSSPAGFIQFPSPRLQAAENQTWSGYPASLSGRRPSYERMPSPRPQSSLEQGLATPQTSALPRRPSTLYDEASPPVTATLEGFPGVHRAEEWRPRRGSASATYRQVPSPFADESRRASESSVGSDGAEPSLLPYAVSPEAPWLSVPGSRREVDFDAQSVAGTVSSQATTIRARRNSDEDDSADTARAMDWKAQFARMLENGGDGTMRPLPQSMLDDEDEEATLFITGPSRATESPQQFSRPTLRQSQSRPNLFVNTSDTVDLSQLDAGTSSDSATESDSDGRVHRAKSFRPPKDEPEQWHVRPEPEALYENLDNYFPKIDLDKPIVDGQLSTPTTPAESPKTESIPPPPLHPSRQHIPSPKEDLPKPAPPPQHPTRTTVAALQNAAGFNRSENRKSIRVMADYKRKTLLKSDEKKENKPKDDEKPKRRFSMWGHRIQEVTPSKLINGMLSTTVPESPLADGKPATLNWVKGELIGKGSYGRVYIAMNVTTGDMMAVKQVELPATERDRHDRRQLGMIDALKSEIALLKDLYHPNIVAYLGCETSPEYLSIFLEYVPGGTIASIYRTPTIPRFEEQLVKFFTKQILEGLAYLHGRHIWHRDLKGDNILVDSAGVCKISDFGISKQTNDAYDSFGQATTMKGSVFWMAPEVVHSVNERTYSGKVDIWSVGCVVLEMWTGTRPWGELEQVAVMVQLFQNRAQPPLPSDVHLSESANNFMYDQCLAKDPAERPMVRELLQHPWITEVDRNWTFEKSKIGKAVAKRAPKTIRTG